jgi:hypothetical protein
MPEPLLNVVASDSGAILGLTDSKIAHLQPPSLFPPAAKPI